MFKPELCDLCGKCLTGCQWFEASQEEAEAWMKEMMEGRAAPPVDKCITCYACNETCPQGANPFDLIAGLQEKFGRPVPGDRVAELETRYAFCGELTNYPTGEERILSLCVFGKTDGHLIQGELYDLPRVGGKPYFCWVLFSHAAGESVQRRHAQEFVDRLAMTGAKEVVCFHDDCYTMLARLAPDYGIKVPFRPIHLSEYLVEYLKANKDRIRPLDKDIAYQRNCASRFTPEKEHFVDELFELVGARRVERKYDRLEALCCGGVKLMMGQGDPRPDQEANIGDAKAAGAQAMACLCPVCIHSLSGVASEMDMPLIFLGDMARMALGEMSWPGKS